MLAFFGALQGAVVISNEISDFWHLCDELTVYQAAHLIIGVTPGEVEAMASVGAELTPKGHARYSCNLQAATQAITAALRAGKIAGTHVPLFDHDINGNPCGEIERSTDVDRSSVERDSLIDWLSSRGIRSGFFFPAANDAPDYLDPKNPRYAPKLAAAVRAWQSVVDPGGKHPKQALAKWLREHAADFGMTDDEGKPNETGIEEAAKVANWQPGGGAPKTPGE